MKQIILLSLSFFALTLSGQNPFNCAYEAYLFQYNDVYAVNLASGQATLIGEDITEGNINAAAYNPSDGYIWGYISKPSNSVIRLGKDLSFDIYSIPEYRSAYVGAIDAEGLFYSKSGSTSYDVVDLNPNSVSYLTVLEQRDLSEHIRIADWAINAADGMLYTASSGENQLIRVDPATGQVEQLGEIPVLAGFNYAYGAVYFDVDGNFYISANQTGSIYKVNAVQNINQGDPISSNIFAYGPSSASNDGARCPTASVPQEICDNGIDDDGDGLIDCDDPSCSGVGACPVDSNVSGGNSGGLESNNRLSEAIGTRNFFREKKNVEFDANQVPQLAIHLPGQQQALSKNGMQIDQLLPVGILSEDKAVESTPADLLDITNASQVYSIDYIKQQKTCASVLALKTIDGVYEHSKFICDRLLGASLNSVATMYIKDQAFIRSIIYKENGVREFVISFAARETPEGIVIESHWNLDQYSKNEDFYNFQIWTNNINDLMTLTEGILDLIEEQNEIVSFQLGKPPYVFVERAKYENGKMKLQLMNNSFSTTATLTGGMKSTETSDTYGFEYEFELKPYRNEIEVPTNRFFDLGFRVSSDKSKVPDDLYVSNGVWGYDDSGVATNVFSFEVRQNQNAIDDSSYEVERGFVMQASSKSYVSVYRALTSRFLPVDLSEFEQLTFEARGSGNMEVRLIKESIADWDEQAYATIALQASNKKYVLNINDFNGGGEGSLTWDDIKLVEFTVRSENGEMKNLSFAVSEIMFGHQATTSTFDEALEASNRITAYPSPTSNNTELTWDSNDSREGLLKCFNSLGQLVNSEIVKYNEGQNRLRYSMSNLPSGNYILELIPENQKDIKTIRVVKY